MINEQIYNRYKKEIAEYEAEQKRLNKYSGKSKCPFCNGSKTTPYVRHGRSQNCEMCDMDGLITNRKLAEFNLTDCINVSSKVY